MIHYKTREEVKTMAYGGAILAEVLFEVLKHAKVGVSELELDNLAETLVRKKGAEPGFQKVEGYKHSTCISTNEVVVHGIPTEYRLKEGDVIGIDCGVYYKGFHTDAAHTVLVQKSKVKSQKSGEADTFLKIGEKAMWEGIKAAKAGSRVGHISKTIQEIVEGAGDSGVRSLIGHGVGRDLHEEPEIPGFLGKDITKTLLLKEGMTIAVEVIYTIGKADVEYTRQDGWTIKTVDGSISGLFERTIAITENGPVVLTK